MLERSNWNNIHWPCSIMRAPFTPFGIICLWCTEGGRVQVGLHDAESFSLLDRLYTQRNIFEILLNQPEISFYLPFSDWFETKQTLSFCVPNQLEKGKYNLISVWFNKVPRRFLCVLEQIYSGQEFMRKNFSSILINETKFGLWIHFSDWFVL